MISANKKEFKISADENLLLVKIFFEEASQCGYCRKPVWVCGKSKLTLVWDFFLTRESPRGDVRPTTRSVWRSHDLHGQRRDRDLSVQ